MNNKVSIKHHLTSAFENFYRYNLHCFHSLPSIHCGSMPLPKATACIPAITPSTKAWRGQIAPTLTPRGLFLARWKIECIGIQRSKLIGLMSSYVCMSHHPYMWSPLDAVRILSLPPVWYAACRWIESERSKTHRWRTCSAWGKCLGYRATKNIIQNWKETKSADWTLPCGA